MVIKMKMMPRFICLNHVSALCFLLYISAVSCGVSFEFFSSLSREIREDDQEQKSGKACKAMNGLGQLKGYKKINIEVSKFDSFWHPPYDSHHIHLLSLSLSRSSASLFCLLGSYQCIAYHIYEMNENGQ